MICLFSYVEAFGQWIIEREYVVIEERAEVKKVEGHYLLNVHALDDLISFYFAHLIKVSPHLHSTMGYWPSF